jgi:arsenate reductase
VNPYAIAVMREAGIDLSGQRSKNVADYLGQHFAWIITVCDNARESCPIFPGMALREHWPLEDPADATGSEEEILTVFRKTRDEVEARVQDFLTRTTNR